MKRISRIACELNLSPLDGFVGKSCAEINSELDLGVNMTGKSFVRSIINRMIDKCGVEIDALKYDYKIVRVDQFGIAKNHPHSKSQITTRLSKKSGKHRISENCSNQPMCSSS